MLVDLEREYRVEAAEENVWRYKGEIVFNVEDMMLT
jgi:hypothetical protein